MIANSEIKINKDTTYLIEALKVEGYWSSENFTITIQNKNLPLLNHIENIAKNLGIKVGKRTLLKIRLNEGAQKEDIKILSGKKELNFHIEKSPFDENKLKAVTSLSYKKNQKINLSYRNNRHSIKITYLKEGILCKSDLECWAYGDLRFPNKKLLSFLDKYANKKKLEIGDYLSLKNPELIASAFSALIDCEGSINHYQLYRKLRVRMRAKDYLEQWANLLKQNGIGCKFRKNNDKEYEINISGWEDFDKLSKIGVRFYNSKKEKSWKEIMNSFKRNQISRNSYKKFYVEELNKMNKKVTSKEFANYLKKSKRVVNHYLSKLKKDGLVQYDKTHWPHLYFISTSSVR